MALEKKDFESLGFNLDKSHDDLIFEYINFPFKLEHIPEKRKIHLYYFKKKYEMFGMIYPKNKSELKKWLKIAKVI